MDHHHQVPNMGMLLIFTITSLALLNPFASLCNAQGNTTLQVGVILDVHSPVGRIGLTSLWLALSDFYSLHTNYSTRLELHIRDSRGQLTGAAAAALNLLKDVRVDAIIGPQKSAEANFVIGLGDAAKVPIISFSATSPSLDPQTQYFLQTALSDAAQVDVVAAIVDYFRWCQVVFVYEDSDYGNGIVPSLSNAFQEVNVRVSYRSIIPISATDDFILRELYKMKTMQTRVFVVHMSSSLASKFFLKAEEAEMMGAGYVWILTSGLMDLFYSLDSQVVESIQGALGVKPLIPDSTTLRSTTERWNNKFQQDYPGFSQGETISLFGLWAYDTTWALAMAAEKIGFREPSSLQNTSALNSTNMFVTEVSQTGPKLLAAMLETSFQELSGDFHLVNGQLVPSSFQILNVNGKVLREVGVWTLSARRSRERNVNVTSFSGGNLKSVIWPGESLRPPKGWEFPVSGKKLRVGVPSVAGFSQFIKVETDPQTNATKISGYYVDLFDAVMAALPYAVRYEYVPFDLSSTPSGSYNNLSHAVNNGTFDVVVGDITITAERSKYVDFTLPVEEGGVTVTQNIEYDDPNDKWFFLKPLRKDLWLTTIALIFLTGVALWILEHRVNRAFRGPAEDHAGLIFYIPFMSLVFANRERIVSNLGRLVLVVWIFVVLILSSTYTASLSARLTVFKLKKVDIDVNELMKNGDNVGCREGSYIIDYLKNLGFDDNKIKRYKRPEDFDAALSNGSTNDGITAMFARTPYTNLFLSKYCNKYMKVGAKNFTSGIAFAFSKGSPLVPDVSRAIVKLTDSHMISDINKRWIKHSACNEDELGPSNGQNIHLDSFKVLFGITAGITATCLMVFLLSYCYNNRDFIRRISNSGATTWSKIRAVSKHFDQRDPKSFRSSRPKEEAGEIASPERYVYAGCNTVVPVSPEEMPSENGALSPNLDRRTAAASHQPNSVELENIRVA